MSPYTSSEGSSFQDSSRSVARRIFCASRACTAWTLDWDAETLELWPASVMAETACGSLVNSSFTTVPAPTPWRMVEDGLAVVGASPFTATTRSPTWLGLGLGLGLGLELGLG